MADYNINAVTRRVVYDGSSGLGPYAFNFEILDQNDINVYFNETLLTITTDYTVTINANGKGSVTIVTGGSVPSTPVAADQITIIGARDIERTTDFVTAGDLRAAALNEQLDALTIFDQQISERVDRSVQFPSYEPAGLNYTVPDVDDRKGKYLAFDNNGELTSTAGTTSDIVVSSFGGTLIDDVNASAARTTLGLGSVATLSSIPTANIDNNAVTNAKMADDSVGSAEIIDNSVTASELNVTGNGTSGQALVSDGDGSMTWTTINVYPQVITIKTSGNYTIPSNAQAILIKASGAGGSGAVRHDNNTAANGNDGGATTVVNSTISVDISAAGGKGGEQPSSLDNKYSDQAASTTGDTIRGAGAQGGRPRNSEFDISAYEGLNGALVQQYVTGSSIQGETLTITYGTGGTGVTASGLTSENGQNGFVELWVW